MKEYRKDVLTVKDIAYMMDPSVLKLDTTIRDVEAMVEACRKYDFGSCFCWPCYYPQLVEMLKGTNTAFGTSLAFPSGQESTETKVYLAHDLFKIYLNPAEGGKIYQLGCAAFFFAVGAGLAVWSGMKLIKGDYVKNGERADGGETQTDEESAEDAGAADGTKEAAEETPEADDTEKIINIQEDDGNDRS